jgi:4-hydroxythreonine-4-phosphate dehydrogenase
MNTKPILGIPLGDSAGVGPEIIAKSTVNGFLFSHCRPVIIGDRRIFERALKLLGQRADNYSISDVREAKWDKGLPILDQKDQDPALITTGEIQAYCGKAVLNMISVACDLCKQDAIKGICFGPFNKAAQKAAGSNVESELVVFANHFGVTTPYGELNVVHNLMTTRATSHIPLKEVSSNLTVPKVLDAINLSYQTLRLAGVEKPRIGIAGLNPHNGENGRCGREEIDIIAPAVKKANESGINVAGPFSADTIFIRAFAGGFDCVVTMYHDQGQIALKLMAFEEGVSVLGGLPYPVATPAHGSAFDIAGKGIAKTSAFERALSIVAKMAVTD